MTSDVSAPFSLGLTLIVTVLLAAGCAWCILAPQPPIELQMQRQEASPAHSEALPLFPGASPQ